MIWDRLWGHRDRRYIVGGGQLLIATTIATGFARHHWIADLLANLRVQQCLAILVLIGLCLMHKRWGWAMVAGFCLAVHLPWFVPPKSTPAPQVAGDTVTVAVCNVLSSNQQLDAILSDVLQDEPDVFVILELTSRHAQAIKRYTSADYPHVVEQVDDLGNFGIGLYSRHPLHEPAVFALNTSVPSIDATVAVDGKRYRILGTHPLPPVSREQFLARNEHLKQLAIRIRNEPTEAGGVSTIVVGDLNITPWSPFYRDFEAASGLRRASRGLALTPTWYRFPLFPFGLVLDHALISDDLHLLSRRIGGPIGSDHRSVTVTVGLK